MLIETLLAAKTVKDFIESGDFPFDAVPAGSELGLGERYIVIVSWPSWGEFAKVNPPADDVIRGELAAIGCDSASINSQDRAKGFLIEIEKAGVNVHQVQAVFAAHMGLAIVCYVSGAADMIPEISWDLLEGFQAAVDSLENTDWAWWSRTVATWAIVIVLVIGVLLVLWFVMKKKAARA